jgi:hypothetical protein
MLTCPVRSAPPTSPNTFPTAITVPLWPGIAEYKWALRIEYQPALNRPNTPSNTTIAQVVGASRKAG